MLALIRMRGCTRRSESALSTHVRITFYQLRANDLTLSVMAHTYPFALVFVALIPLSANIVHVLYRMDLCGAKVEHSLCPYETCINLGFPEF